MTTSCRQLTRIVSCRWGLVLLVGLLHLVTSGHASAQPAKFIKEGVAPGKVYSFVGTEHQSEIPTDIYAPWFLNEFVSDPGLLTQAISSTYWEKQTVQIGIDQAGRATEITEPVPTLHVAARSAAAAGAKIDAATFQTGQIWAFQVTSEENHTGSRRVSGILSGRIWLRGQLSVFGSGQARAEARVVVRERNDAPTYITGTEVLSESIASYEINHPYEFSVDGSLGVEIGAPFCGGEGGLGAGRIFSNERIRLASEPVDFSFPVDLRVGQRYEVEVLFHGSAENRGLLNQFSAVVFANSSDLGLLSASDTDDLFVSESDAQHLLDSVQFFDLNVPNIEWGGAINGAENWQFPSIAGLTAGKFINMANTYRIEPLGKILSVAEAIDVLGISPNLGENLAGSGGSGEGQFSGGVVQEAGGVWIGDLVLSLEEL